MRMRAELRGTVIAESDDTVLYAGHHYFPPEAVTSRLVRPSGIRRSVLGTAARFDVCADGTRASDAAWCFARPRWWSRRLRGRIAFATNPRRALVSTSGDRLPCPIPTAK